MEFHSRSYDPARKKMQTSRNMYTVLLFSLLFHHMVGKEATAAELLGSASTTQYVEMGICENIQTGSKRCAMQASDCQFDHWNGEMSVHLEAFYSAHEQKQFGSTTTAGGGGADLCSCETTQIGSCNDRCSPQRYGYCFANESFHEHFNSLTSSTDPSSSSSAAASSTNSNSCTCQNSNYGACQNFATGQYFCAFSPNDCVVAGHLWIHPQDTQDILGITCTCNKVKVGGCVGERGQRFTCAVSSDDCLRREHYQAPYDLKMMTGRTCNLCKPLSSSSSASMNDDGSVVPYEDELSNVEKERAGGGGKNRASGILTFFLVCVFAIAVTFVLLRHSKRATARRNETGASTISSSLSAEWRLLRSSNSGDKHLDTPGEEQMFPCVMAKGPDAEII